MSRAPNSGARTRLRYLGRLAGTTIATFALATAVYAPISPISPGSGTVEPGDSTTATFTLEPPPLIILPVQACVSVASVSPSFEGTVTLTPACALLSNVDVDLTVTADSTAAPGTYDVTISETALGVPPAQHEWTFTVPEPPTTTTTTTTTTTSTTTTPTAPTTTPTTSPTTATTQPEPTTNSTAPTSGDATTPTTTGPSTGPITVDPTPTTEGNDTTSSTGDGPSGTSPDDDEEVVAAGPPEQGPPYDRDVSESGGDDPEFLSSTELSGQLRNQISGTVPISLADAVLSPVVITEFVIRSLLSSALSLLIPLLIATLIGLWMVWRMREEVDVDQPSLSTESLV